MVARPDGLAEGMRWTGTGGTTPHERAVCVSTPERHLRCRHDAASVRGRRAVSADCISSSNFLGALRRAAAATLPPPMKNEPRGGDAARRRGRSTACAENRDLEISPEGSWRGAAPAHAGIGDAPAPPSAGTCTYEDVYWFRLWQSSVGEHRVARVTKADAAQCCFRGPSLGRRWTLFRFLTDCRPIVKREST